VRKIIFVVCGLLLACAPALYVPDASVAERTGFGLDDLQQGRRLYVDHCGSCHQLHLPREYSLEKWRTELDSMQSRAKLSDSQKEQIYRFIRAGK
jgi:mono/diheme cytochrome c family protein